MKTDIKVEMGYIRYPAKDGFPSASQRASYREQGYNQKYHNGDHYIFTKPNDVPVRITFGDVSVTYDASYFLREMYGLEKIQEARKDNFMSKLKTGKILLVFDDGKYLTCAEPHRNYTYSQRTNIRLWDFIYRKSETAILYKGQTQEIQELENLGYYEVETESNKIAVMSNPVVFNLVFYVKGRRVEVPANHLVKEYYNGNLTQKRCEEFFFMLIQNRIQITVDFNGFVNLN